MVAEIEQNGYGPGFCALINLPTEYTTRGNTCLVVQRTVPVRRDINSGPPEWIPHAEPAAIFLPPREVIDDDV